MITTHPLELAAELLLHIMEYLPKGAAAAAAITCQAWKDPALDILWRKINLEHLLSVLAPLKVEEDKLVSEQLTLSSVLTDVNRIYTDSTSLEHQHGKRGHDSSYSHLGCIGHG